METTTANGLYECYRSNDRQTGSSSEQGDLVAQTYSAEIVRFVTSALGQKFIDVENALQRCWREAYRPNWDGPGSFPVSYQTYCSAIDFIRSFPMDFTAKPTVYPEAEGGLGFDWENENGDSITVLVRDTRLVYSAILMNGDRLRGVLRLRDGKLPNAIYEILLQMFAEG